MHRERRLHIGEGGDDDAPDALRGIERQDAGVAINQAPHHLGLARRRNARTLLFRLLDLDQTIENLAALNQQAVHRLVDSIDLAPQLRQRGHVGMGGRRHGALLEPAVRLRPLIGAGRRESKENIDSRERRPI
jgi:hypothetical protein